MSTVVLTAIITAIVGPICGILVKYWVDKGQTNLKNIDKKLSEIQDNMLVHSTATRNMIRVELVNTMTYAIKRGYTTTLEWQEMANLYDSYKSLNGNSVVDKIFSDYSKLQIKDKGENK